ncbi:hypothetical protein KY290_032021 [Solanum tuberosum]|uniref:RNase H type-1 domain-containing protein n=1 Tax=Solanum tuberosum TaxID=4113 RepID=A0ABQ7UB03_SOLTU|nr:hypothetical protein KY290_032021 [Solanum tuberosum]
MTVRVDVNTNMKGDNEIDGDGGVTKHKQANFSTMTDSSNMSKLMLNDRSTSSRGHSAEKLSKVEATITIFWLVALNSLMQVRKLQSIAGTNYQAELEAAIYGLRWCVQQGFQHVILEVDSELLSKWVRHQMKPPWNLHNFNQWLVEITRVFHSFTCIPIEKLISPQMIYLSIVIHLLLQVITLLPISFLTMLKVTTNWTRLVWLASNEGRLLG